MPADPIRSIHLRQQFMISYINYDGQGTEYVFMLQLPADNKHSTYFVCTVSGQYLHHDDLTLQYACIMHTSRTGGAIYAMSSQESSLRNLLHITVLTSSQDDSLMRQMVTLKGTHEYPFTDVHTFKALSCIAFPLNRRQSYA